MASEARHPVVTQGIVTLLLAYEDGICCGMEHPDSNPIRRQYIDDDLHIVWDRGRRVGQEIGKVIERKIRERGDRIAP